MQTRVVKPFWPLCAHVPERLRHPPNPHLPASGCRSLPEGFLWSQEQGTWAGRTAKGLAPPPTRAGAQAHRSSTMQVDTMQPSEAPAGLKPPGYSQGQPAHCFSLVFPRFPVSPPHLPAASWGHLPTTYVPSNPCLRVFWETQSKGACTVLDRKEAPDKC